MNYFRNKKYSVSLGFCKSTYYNTINMVASVVSVGVGAACLIAVNVESISNNYLGDESSKQGVNNLGYALIGAGACNLLDKALRLCVVSHDKKLPALENITSNSGDIEMQRMQTNIRDENVQKLGNYLISLNEGQIEQLGQYLRENHVLFTMTGQNTSISFEVSNNSHKFTQTIRGEFKRNENTNNLYVKLNDDSKIDDLFLDWITPYLEGENVNKINAKLKKRGKKAYLVAEDASIQFKIRSSNDAIHVLSGKFNTNEDTKEFYIEVDNCSKLKIFLNGLTTSFVSKNLDKINKELKDDGIKACLITENSKLVFEDTKNNVEYFGHCSIQEGNLIIKPENIDELSAFKKGSQEYFSRLSDILHNQGFMAMKVNNLGITDIILDGDSVKCFIKYDIQENKLSIESMGERHHFPSYFSPLQNCSLNSSTMTIESPEARIKKITIDGEEREFYVRYDYSDNKLKINSLDLTTVNSYQARPPKSNLEALDGCLLNEYRPIEIKIPRPGVMEITVEGEERPFYMYYNSSKKKNVNSSSHISAHACDDHSKADSISFKQQEQQEAELEPEYDDVRTSSRPEPDKTTETLDNFAYSSVCILDDNGDPINRGAGVTFKQDAINAQPEYEYIEGLVSLPLQAASSKVYNQALSSVSSIGSGQGNRTNRGDEITFQQDRSPRIADQSSATFVHNYEEINGETLLSDLERWRLKLDLQQGGSSSGAAVSDFQTSSSGATSQRHVESQSALQQSGYSAGAAVSNSPTYSAGATSHNHLGSKPALQQGGYSYADLGQHRKVVATTHQYSAGAAVSNSHTYSAGGAFNNPSKMDCKSTGYGVMTPYPASANAQSIQGNCMPPLPPTLPPKNQVSNTKSASAIGITKVEVHHNVLPPVPPPLPPKKNDSHGSDIYDDTMVAEDIYDDTFILQKDRKSNSNSNDITLITAGTALVNNTSASNSMSGHNIRVSTYSVESTV